MQHCIIHVFSHIHSPFQASSEAILLPPVLINTADQGLTPKLTLEFTTRWSAKHTETFTSVTYTAKVQSPHLQKEEKDRSNTTLPALAPDALLIKKLLVVVKTNK